MTVVSSSNPVVSAQSTPHTTTNILTTLNHPNNQHNVNTITNAIPISHNILSTSTNSNGHSNLSINNVNSVNSSSVVVAPPSLQQGGVGSQQQVVVNQQQQIASVSRES